MALMHANAVALLSLLLLIISASADLDMSIISYHSIGSEVHAMVLFESWISEHAKTYNGIAEKQKRFQIFKDNLKYINDHNALDRPYKLGLNHFADLTNQEYRESVLCNLLPSPRNTSQRYALKAGENLPESIDWTKKGAVAPIKNQLTCDTCWAFSAISAVEGINQIETGDLKILSEQELIDCDDNNGHCHGGGLMDKAFEFIINNGIHKEVDYPYKATDGNCEATKEGEKVFIDSYENVPQNEEALMKAVAHQPVSVAIAAESKDFMFYKSGVFTKECGPALSHAVTVVGYGRTEEGKDYWIVRNSWGPNWGDNGYIKMERNLSGNNKGKCDIASHASYPVKKGPNPSYI